MSYKLTAKQKGTIWHELNHAVAKVHAGYDPDNVCIILEPKSCPQSLGVCFYMGDELVLSKEMHSIILLVGVIESNMSVFSTDKDECLEFLTFYRNEFYDFVSQIQSCGINEGRGQSDWTKYLEVRKDENIDDVVFSDFERALDFMIENFETTWSLLENWQIAQYINRKYLTTFTITRLQNIQ